MLPCPEEWELSTCRHAVRSSVYHVSSQATLNTESKFVWSILQSEFAVLFIRRTFTNRESKKEFGKVTTLEYSMTGDRDFRFPLLLSAMVSRYKHLSSKRAFTEHLNNPFSVWRHQKLKLSFVNLVNHISDWHNWFETLKVATLCATQIEFLIVRACEIQLTLIPTDYDIIIMSLS